MNPPDDLRAARRAVAVAGHTGDEVAARSGLVHGHAEVRVAALGALERLGVLDVTALQAAGRDPDRTVRRRAAELAAAHRDVDLLPLLGDDDPSVVEVAAWACGEHESDRDAVVERLIELAAHDEPLVRESAVAALGAIGDRRGLDAIVAAVTGDRPAVRRRAVLALAPFDGPSVDAALEHALADRDWQVRQNAEDITG